MNAGSAETSGGQPTDAVVSALHRLAALAREVEDAQLSDEAVTLAERVAEGRFFVACVGQFKRGKSTLLNALVGDAVLPAGVVPVTTVVTVLRYGPRRSARVQTAQGWTEVDPSSLAAFVAEEQNPANQKGVTAVEVSLPSPLLATGMCLVDTPGIGSVFEGASAATRAFVPHIDAALVVVGGDPPISAEEVALVKEVSAHVAEMLVVMNKADRLSEADRSEVKGFTARVLGERLGKSIDPILEVSALERLTRAGPPRDWDRLRSALEAMATGAGVQLVQAAGTRGLVRLAQRLLHQLDEEQGALSRPVEESERRIAALKQCAAEAERSLEDLASLLSSEQARLGRKFAERREAFLARAISAARRELGERLRSAGELRGSALRQRGIALAQEIFKEWVDRWRAEEQPQGEQLYRESAQRFVDIANGFLERLAATGDPALSALPRGLVPEVGFRTRSRLYYTEIMALTGGSIIEWVVDLLRSREAALRSVERGAGAYLERLLTANANRVTSDLDDRVLESRRRLEAEVRRSLKEIHGSAERALEGARAKRMKGQGAVEGELRRLEALRRDIETLSPSPREVH